MHGDDLFELFLFGQLQAPTRLHPTREVRHLHRHKPHLNLFISLTAMQENKRLIFAATAVKLETWNVNLI